VRYFDVRGVRRRRSFASIEEAEFERARLALEAVAPITRATAVLDTNEGSMLLRAFWQIWLADVRSAVGAELAGESWERVSRVGEVNAVRMTAEQVEAVASWSVGGPEFVAVLVHGCAPAYALDWKDGDVLATQGDAHIHVAPNGRIKDVVPGP